MAEIRENITRTPIAAPPAPSRARAATPSTGDPDHDFLRRMSDHHLDLIRITHAAIESNRDASLAAAIRRFEEAHDHELDALLSLLQRIYNDAFVPQTNPENDFIAEMLRKHRSDNMKALLEAAEKSEADAVRILNDYLPKSKQRQVRSLAEKLRREESAGVVALRKALSRQ